MSVEIPSAAQASLSIVIVNWNAGHRLRDCLESIAKHGQGLVRRTIVVDNDSIDGSEAGADQLPGVTLVRAGANLGFGKGCNLGARQAQGDYLLFLNPDAALHEGTLPRVLAFMQDPANARVGICGVQLLDASGRVARSCARLPSVSGLVAQSVGLDRLFPRLGHFMVEWDHARTREVDQVIGAFFFVRRELFEALGGFDERFFVYFEEVDFTLRARRAGWRTVYVADAQAFHAGRGTTEQVKALRLFYFLRSRLQYVSWHFAWPGIVAVLLATLFLEPVSRSGLAVLHRSWSGLRETWAAYGMLWRWLPAWAFRGEPE